MITPKGVSFPPNITGMASMGGKSLGPIREVEVKKPHIKLSKEVKDKILGMQNTP